MKRASRTGANMRAVSAMELAEMRRHSARVRACAEALALPNRRAENPVRYGVLFLTPQEPGRAGFSNSFQHGGAPKFSAILTCPRVPAEELSPTVDRSCRRPLLHTVCAPAP